MKKNFVVYTNKKANVSFDTFSEETTVSLLLFTSKSESSKHLFPSFHPEVGNDINHTASHLSIGTKNPLLFSPSVLMFDSF